jgi:hypothetical protein
MVGSFLRLDFQADGVTSEGCQSGYERFWVLLDDAAYTRYFNLASDCKAIVSFPHILQR